ncbi:pentapeptide repeat-containing protein [Pelagimonas varians]|nr:pentapeptide repeat-containing protein [Pelagimonas varians]
MEQTATAKAALFNSKITEAAADLHATRQVSKKVGKNKWETVWEDDIVRRNAAIDRLEGLVREEPAEAGRVSRLLSVYVRELSKEYPAQKTPDTDDIKKLKDWAKALKIARSDIENAVQMLGRLADINGVYSQNLEIDLRRANLQAMDLKRLSYPSANFDHAQMQGALLSHSSLENASFCHADMKNAVLYKISASFAFFTGTIMQSAVLDFSTFTKADFTGAKLNRAKLQGCDLTQAHLTGAIMKSTSFAAADIRMVHLRGIVICEDADLTMANLQGSAVKGSDFGQLQHIADHLDTVFGDDTTRLPNGVSKLNHWPQEELSFGDFEVQWRKWTMTIDIDIPE